MIYKLYLYICLIFRTIFKFYRAISCLINNTLKDIVLINFSIFYIKSVIFICCNNFTVTTCIYYSTLICISLFLFRVNSKSLRFVSPGKRKIKLLSTG